MIGPALEALVADLKTAGLRATADPRNLNPPCAWVKADQFDPDTLCSVMSGQLTVKVLLICGDNAGIVQTHNTLSDMLTKALTVVDPTGPIEIDTVTLSSGGPALPAYVLGTDLDI